MLHVDGSQKLESCWGTQEASENIAAGVFGDRPGNFRDPETRDPGRVLPSTGQIPGRQGWFDVHL